MNKKQVIRINENQLKQIVMESVKKQLNEISITGFYEPLRNTYKTVKDLRDMWSKLNFGVYYPKYPDEARLIASALNNVVGVIEKINNDSSDGGEDEDPYDLRYID